MKIDGNTKPRALELLAPAGNVEIGRQAIVHGADAVYIGGSSHGARAKASNSVDDIARLVDFAAPYGVKIYVTVNTIVYDAELRQVEKLVGDLYRIGVDALIVQDMSLLRLDIPPIALHASTQCDTRDAAKARFLADCGFSQIVIARECSLAETAEICRAVDVPVEAFVHGALCVSYSGDCRASYAIGGRSANRGCCAQVCRMPFDLIDGDGSVVARDRHLLSLRDLNRLNDLEAMAAAGVSSFKIEGRMKDASYVKNVTAAYRAALDRLIQSNPDKYFRPSRGIEQIDFRPQLQKSFNRGFTDYFTHGRPSAPLAFFDSPKSIGERVGSVVSSSRNTLTAHLEAALNNGDGLTFRCSDGSIVGGRLNRIDGNRLIMQKPLSLPKGTPVYRNSDIRWDDMLSRPTATRTVPIAVELTVAPDGRFVLSGRIIDENVEVTVTTDFMAMPAQKSGTEARRKTLSKLGDTPYRLAEFTDRCDDRFIPLSELTAMRRKLTDALTDTIKARKPLELRRPMKEGLRLERRLTVHDNVANVEAEKFYRGLGATVTERAAEVSGPVKPGSTVMTTRYCLRREMGACLKEGGAEKLKEPLKLVTGPNRFELEFDCRNCRMNVIFSK